MCEVCRRQLASVWADRQRSRGQLPASSASAEAAPHPSLGGRRTFETWPQMFNCKTTYYEEEKNKHGVTKVLNNIHFKLKKLEISISFLFVYFDFKDDKCWRYLSGVITG